jgi:hypothetical protein
MVPVRQPFLAPVTVAAKQRKRRTKMLSELKKQLTYPATPMYEKFGTVEARHVAAGETVIIMINRVETYYVANEGDMVLTGANGEEYVVGKTKFHRLYEETDKPGTYKAKGVVKAVRVPAGTPYFHFRAPWGEQHLVHEGDYIATSQADNFDPEKCFRIRKSVFEATYRKC